MCPTICWIGQRTCEIFYSTSINYVWFDKIVYQNLIWEFFGLAYWVTCLHLARFTGRANLFRDRCVQPSVLVQAITNMTFKTLKFDLSTPNYQWYPDYNFICFIVGLTILVYTASLSRLRRTKVLVTNECVQPLTGSASAQARFFNIDIPVSIPSSHEYHQSRDNQVYPCGQSRIILI